MLLPLKDVAELRIYRGTCKLGLKDLPGATTEFEPEAGHIDTTEWFNR